MRLVHGANRLGTNSLLDLIVFGKHAGLRAAEFANGADFQPLPADPTEFTQTQFDAIRNAQGNEKILEISKKMKNSHDGLRGYVPHRGRHAICAGNCA